MHRATGGDHHADNLILLCGAHHRAYHDDKIRITGSPDHLVFTHADGSPYGTNLLADAHRALRDAGIETSTARAAVDRASAHVGRNASLRDLVRTSFAFT